MRTLTLGVLIVSGGTLAALPFRRYQAIPDASSGPVQATGPTQSAMGDVKLEMLVDAGAGDAGTGNQDDMVAQLPSWQPPAPPQQRHVTAPLSYEDLAVPIDRPQAMERRFNATVSARQTQIEKERTAGLVMPRIESLALSQQAELRSHVAAIENDSDLRNAETTGPAMSAKLASSASSRSSESLRKSQAAERQSNIESLPANQPPQREKHWIRQPL